MTKEQWFSFFISQIEELYDKDIIYYNCFGNLNESEKECLLSEIDYVLKGDSISERISLVVNNACSELKSVIYRTTEGRIIQIVLERNNLEWITIYSNNCITQFGSSNCFDCLGIYRVFGQGDKYFYLEKRFDVGLAQSVLEVYEKAEENTGIGITDRQIKFADPYHNYASPTMKYYLVAEGEYVKSRPLKETETPLVFNLSKYPDFLQLDSQILLGVNYNALINKLYEEYIMPRIDADVERLKVMRNPSEPVNLETVLLRIPEGYSSSISQTNAYFLPNAETSKGIAFNECRVLLRNRTYKVRPSKVNNNP